MLVSRCSDSGVFIIDWHESFLCSVLVLARTELIFTAPRRGALSSQRWILAQSNVNGSPILNTLVTIVVVTVSFLISLLFLVNCSYLNLRSSPFCASNSPLHPSEGVRGDEGEVSERAVHSGSTKLGNTIPKLLPVISYSHRKHPKEIDWP